MKTKQTLFLLVLLIPAIVFGQVNVSKDFKVEVGNPYPVIDAPSKEYFSNDKGQTISIKTAGEKATVLRYDIKSMSEISRKVTKTFLLLPNFRKS